MLRRHWLLGCMLLLSSGCVYKFGVLGAQSAPIKGERGARASGDSCVFMLLGIQFGLVALPEEAVKDAVARANVREKRQAPDLYNALENATLREDFTAFSHCFHVDGIPVQVREAE